MEGWLRFTLERELAPTFLLFCGACRALVLDELLLRERLTPLREGELWRVLGEALLVVLLERLGLLEDLALGL